MPPLNKSERETGIKPSNSSKQKSNNSNPSLAYNSAKSNTTKGETTLSDSKTATIPEQEKQAFLHPNCAAGVHQKYPHRAFLAGPAAQNLLPGRRLAQ